jgi:hypothetical protein
MTTGVDIGNDVRGRRREEEYVQTSAGCCGGAGWFGVKLDGRGI